MEIEEAKKILLAGATHTWVKWSTLTQGTKCWNECSQTTVFLAIKELVKEGSLLEKTSLGQDRPSLYRKAKI